MNIFFVLRKYILILILKVSILLLINFEIFIEDTLIYPDNIFEFDFYISSELDGIIVEYILYLFGIYSNSQFILISFLKQNY